MIKSRPMQSERITFIRPDDWHVHVRDQDVLAAVINDTVTHFARAIVMPNLKPPVTTMTEAAAYRERIEAVAGSGFTPLMTCYLTDRTQPADLIGGHAQGVFTAAKLYPAGATTNSSAGVTDVLRLDSVFSAMTEVAMPLLIHGEVVDDNIDIFDREAVFIERTLKPLRDRHPNLKIVLEHITTSDAVDYVASCDAALVAATITPHHLCLNRNAMFKGGIQPHHYCLPVIKRERHRLALVEAACSGSPQYFLGTDSAPHTVDAKETACGCAGIYNAPSAISSYLEVFREHNALDQFERFASTNGPRFYALEPNTDRVTYERTPLRDGPGERPSSVGPIRIFDPGQQAAWRLVR